MIIKEYYYPYIHRNFIEPVYTSWFFPFEYEYLEKKVKHLEYVWYWHSYSTISSVGCIIFKTKSKWGILSLFYSDELKGASSPILFKNIIWFNSLSSLTSSIKKELLKFVKPLLSSIKTSSTKYLKKETYFYITSYAKDETQYYCSEWRRKIEINTFL